MRPILINDLTIAARTALAVEPCARADLMSRIVANARAADRYRKRTGRSHRLLGNGTLSAACQTHARAPMPHRCDLDYLSCLALVIEALIDRS